MGIDEKRGEFWRGEDVTVQGFAAVWSVCGKVRIRSRNPNIGLLDSSCFKINVL